MCRALRIRRALTITTSEQIQLYEPDIILTGGWGLVSNILHDEILADDAEWVKPNGQTALWY